MSEPAPATFSRWTVTLSILGVVMLVLYRVGVRSRTVPDILFFLKLVLIQLLIYFGVVWLSLRTKDSPQLLVLGLIFAALFRIAILFYPPYLSDDIYRYIWDGRVQSAGINPYRYVPANESLAKLRDDKIYPNINRRDYARTIYPPVAEAAFFLTTRFSESVTWMKAVMVGCEAITVWAVIQLLTSFGLARQRVLIYAWHPLAVWELAGSGHLDALAIAFLAVTLLAHRKRQETLTGILLACATGVKLFPMLLFPAFYRRWSWRMPLAFVVTIVIAYLPYISVGPLGVLGFLPGYASERGMVSGEQFFLLTVTRRLFSVHVPVIPYLIFSVAVLGILSFWFLRDQRNGNVHYVRNCLIIATVFVFLLAPHFTWYFCWLILFLCFVPSISVLYLTATSFLLYLTWINDTADRVFILKTLIFVPCLILGILINWLRRQGYAHLAHE